MPKKEIYLVVAMSRNRVIGKDNKLPWHFPADLKSFKELTMGHTLLMGRKTFDSIGRPLPGRQSIVLTRSGKTKGSPEEPVWFCATVQEALEEAPHDKKVFIIGGAEIFRQTLDIADGLYLTHIGADYEGDVFFPELSAGFVEKRREPIQENPKIERIYYENTEPRPWITENYI